MRQEGLIPRYRQDRENISRAIILKENSVRKRIHLDISQFDTRMSVCVYLRNKG